MFSHHHKCDSSLFSQEQRIKCEGHARDSPPYVGIADINVEMVHLKMALWTLDIAMWS